MQGFELFVFAWGIISIQEEKLGPKESDAFRAAFQGVCGLGGVAKVCEDTDGMAIFCDRAFVTEASDPLRFHSQATPCVRAVPVVCLAAGLSQSSPLSPSNAAVDRCLRRFDSGALEG